MLQPLQLTDVSARYKDEIAELRDFLRKANCVLESIESLHTISYRLQRDRAFHRDLTSHVWVVVYNCNRIISYADLLGILAIAAAGAYFAAEAHEDDAHALLRFVMEARQSLDGVTEQKNIPTADLPTTPFGVPQRVELQIRKQALPDPQAGPSHAEFPSLKADDANGSRKRFILIAACVLAILSTGLALYYHATPNAAKSQVPAATLAAPPIASKETVPSSLRSEATSTTASPSSSTSRSARTMRTVSQARSSHKPLAKKTSITADAPAPQPQVTAAAATTASTVPPPVASNVSPPLLPHAEATPVPAARNAAAQTSAIRLGTSSVSADSSAPDLSNTTRGRQAPQLLRRTQEEQADLVAELRSSDNATSKIGPNTAPSAARGTVQAISLGTNAANVLYGPTPSYPTAANAAHVQGEVKLEANVDREGNVASVRVISGPQPLREAALDAAQRWRYRPNLADGERIPMKAITVFEFKLP